MTARKVHKSGLIPWNSGAVVSRKTKKSKKPRKKRTAKQRAKRKIRRYKPRVVADGHRRLHYPHAGPISLWEPRRKMKSKHVVATNAAAWY